MRKKADKLGWPLSSIPGSRLINWGKRVQVRLLLRHIHSSDTLVQIAGPVTKTTDEHSSSRFESRAASEGEHKILLKPLKRGIKRGSTETECAETRMRALVNLSCNRFYKAAYGLTGLMVG